MGDSAILITEAVQNGYYHTSEDASDRLANDPGSPSGVTYDFAFATDVTRTTVALIAQEAVLVPDFDDDGDVDGNDFLAWQRGESPNPLSQSDLDNWQASFGVAPSGDFDEDGDVDGGDFLYWQINDGSLAGLQLWQENFGSVASSAAATSTAVPEPATGIMLLLGMAVMFTGRRTSVSKPIR